MCLYHGEVLGSHTYARAMIALGAHIGWLGWCHVSCEVTPLSVTCLVNVHFTWQKTWDLM